MNKLYYKKVIRIVKKTAGVQFITSVNIMYKPKGKKIYLINNTFFNESTLPENPN